MIKIPNMYSLVSGRIIQFVFMFVSSFEHKIPLLNKSTTYICTYLGLQCIFVLRTKWHTLIGLISRIWLECYLNLNGFSQVLKLVLWKCLYMYIEKCRPFKYSRNYCIPIFIEEVYLQFSESQYRLMWTYKYNFTQNIT